ncbi:hypothetical protein SAMN02745176_00926 [Lutispora thermophila DSM 19022]|uniref:Uncharacterized protein n=1 Tax=Lutispora thermophila DSM 19022 TaxID=1122184 RepID=A0A1M6CYL6_9FIRM|nr:hypothetical protein SAMN02745176_00926 [Lutispora thermophila DSM 19022]
MFLCFTDFFTNGNGYLSITFSDENMTIEDAVIQCQKSGLNGWEMLDFAEKLVSRHMKYSYDNSLDMPRKAFQKGGGYCWLNLYQRLENGIHGLVFGLILVQL